MKSKATNPLQFSDALARHNGNASAVARELGIPERTARRRANECTAIAPPAPAPVVKPEEVDEIRALRAKLKAVEGDRLTDEYVKAKIIGLRDAPLSVPNWLQRPTAGVHGAMVPTLMLSDLHWGEVVYPRQVNGVNEYDIAIAQNRLRTVVERATSLLTEHLTGVTYPGIVLALGGDMLSGDIHEELSESNEMPVMPALLDLYGVLVWAIGSLATAFGKVFVPCVTGNHGRNTKKPRAKNRNYSNFDWLLYQFLQKHFEGDKRVCFYIPEGSDAHWVVLGHRYCMTHGDQFRGGDGMIGALGPIIRGDHKKRSRNGQVDLGYDTLLLGHWHQLIQLQRLIVNGSLKGYDEYAASGNFGFEPPQQALWLTHERGIVHSMPVLAEAPKRKADREWVKFAA